ncbi:hypothetical protein CGCTS75_v006517 [Colletotrichum tropicale]|nr:hypothetical protein CGCTS75_v006517 [Colletotrichum tropicale]
MPRARTKGDAAKWAPSPSPSPLSLGLTWTETGRAWRNLAGCERDRHRERERRKHGVSTRASKCQGLLSRRNEPRLGVEMVAQHGQDSQEAENGCGLNKRITEKG